MGRILGSYALIVQEGSEVGGMSKCGHLPVSALPSHIALLTMRSSLNQVNSPARLQHHCAWRRAPLNYRRVIFSEGSRTIAGMILKKIGWEGFIPFDLASAFGQSFLHRFRCIRLCRRTVRRCGTPHPDAYRGTADTIPIADQLQV